MEHLFLLVSSYLILSLDSVSSAASSPHHLLSNHLSLEDLYLGSLLTVASWSLHTFQASLPPCGNLPALHSGATLKAGSISVPSGSLRYQIPPLGGVSVGSFLSFMAALLSVSQLFLGAYWNLPYGMGVRLKTLSPFLLGFNLLHGL